MSRSGANQRNDRRPLCMVVGSPRSGTTLALRLLRELPGTAGPPLETAFFPVVGQLLLQSSDGPFYTRREVLDALAKYRNHWRFYGTELAEEDVLRLLGPGEPVHVLDVFYAVVQALSGGASGDILCEKTPQHLWEWPLLEPESKIRVVAIVRDPRAVVEATLRQNWVSDVCLAAGRWVGEQREIERLTGALGPDRVMHVRYEDMVADPESFQERLSIFLAASRSTIGGGD